MWKKLLVVVLMAIALFVSNPNSTFAADSSAIENSAVEVNNAQEIFTANCAGCHPKGGNILRRGKTLKTKALKRNHRDSAETIISLVTNGKGSMGAYGDRLTSSEIELVANYVLERAGQDWK